MEPEGSLPCSQEPSTEGPKIRVYTACSRLTIRPTNDYPWALRRFSIAMRLRTIAGTEYGEDREGGSGRMTD
jgi:hypothetical protein